MIKRVHIEDFEDEKLKSVSYELSNGLKINARINLLRDVNVIVNGSKYVITDDFLKRNKEYEKEKFVENLIIKISKYYSEHIVQITTNVDNEVLSIDFLEV